MALSFETSSDESGNLTTTSIDEQTNISIESCKNGSTSNTRKRKRNKLNDMTVRVVGGSLNDKISGLLDSLADCKQDTPSILGQLFPKNEPELQYGYLIHEIIQKAIDIEKPENCVEIYANLCVQINKKVHVRDKEGPEKLEFVNVLVEKCKEHIDDIQRKEHQVKIQKNKVDAFSIPQKGLLQEEIRSVFEMQYLLDDNKLKIYKKSMCRFIIALCKVEMPKSEDIAFYFIMKSKSPMESLLTTIGKQVAIKLQLFNRNTELSQLFGKVNSLLEDDELPPNMKSVLSDIVNLRSEMDCSEFSFNLAISDKTHTGKPNSLLENEKNDLSPLKSPPHISNEIDCSEFSLCNIFLTLNPDNIEQSELLRNIEQLPLDQHQELDHLFSYIFEMVLKNPQICECWVKFCAKNVSQEGKKTFIAVMIKAFKKYFQQVFFDEASSFQVEEEGKKGFCRLFSLLMNRINFRNTAACILLNTILEKLLKQYKFDFFSKFTKI